MTQRFGRQQANTNIRRRPKPKILQPTETEWKQSKPSELCSVIHVQANGGDGIRHN